MWVRKSSVIGIVKKTIFIRKPVEMNRQKKSMMSIDFFFLS